MNILHINMLHSIVHVLHYEDIIHIDAYVHVYFERIIFHIGYSMAD